MTDASGGNLNVGAFLYSIHGEIKNEYTILIG
jgi:hypothetical protein